ncbi:hypothetical protein ACH5RR_023636 [Cinchona calisaya]|uniref:Uncharacterized protein n=1 Tax=Cinchona calisaya TaxID=153742 RepID=A0ABD2ZB85_9GENT
MNMMRAQNLLTAVRLEAKSSADGAATPPPHNHNPSPSSITTPLLSVSKPSWIVRTESNVQREPRKKPDPPCVVCRGSGRVDCHNCHGIGRTNCTHLTLLPKGEWPKWCKDCGGSGLSYCSRCLGTGEYRYIMGFHFMKMNTDQPGDTERYQVQQKPRARSPADLLQSDELDSSCER